MTFLTCLALSIFAILAFALIFALVANASKDSTGNLGLFSLLSMLLGAVVSGFSSAKIKKEGAVAFSALVALAVVLIMLLCCVIFSGKVPVSAFMNYACYIGVATLSALFGAREKHKRHHKR